MAGRRRGNAEARARRPRPADRRFRRAFVGSALALALAGGVGLFGGAIGEAVSAQVSGAAGWAARTAGLTVQDVTVSGRKYTSAHEILNALGVSRGQAITSVDLGLAHERVAALDWVRTASVERLYPDTIHVTIDEHAPLAVWRTEDGSELVDDRGVVVSGLEVRSFPHLPLVVGPGAASAAPGIVAILARRPAIAERVVAAIRVGERRWTLRLDNGVNVHLPEEGVEVALDQLIGIDQKTGLLGRDITMVDMRLPDRVTVLPAEAGEDAASALAGQGADHNT